MDVLVVARIAVGLSVLRNRTGTRHSDFLSAVEESKGGPSGEDGAVGNSDVDGRRMKLWGAEFLLGVERRMDAMRVVGMRVLWWRLPPAC